MLLDDENGLDLSWMIDLTLWKLTPHSAQYFESYPHFDHLVLAVGVKPSDSGLSGTAQEKLLCHSNWTFC